MPATPTAAHEAPPTHEPLPNLADHAPDSRDSHSRSRRHQPARPAHPPTDDEILGLDTSSPRSPDPAQVAFDFDTTSADPESGPASESAAAAPSNAPDAAEPASFRGIFEANPELRTAWQDAQAYRETFATPEAARAATAQLATLDPHAFTSLAQAITTLVSNAHPAPATGDAVNVARVFRPEDFRPATTASAVIQSEARNLSPGGRSFSSDITDRREAPSALPEAVAQPLAQRQSSAPTAAQAEFFRAANAAAVEGVLDAIESQVERLLPEGVSKSARNRVVGEIYRELDTTLRSNRQLGQQMRDAFRSGSLDTDHQRAIVSLVTGRARQHAAERRIDISGASGAATAGRSASPRSVDYARVSDCDILNL